MKNEGIDIRKAVANMALGSESEIISLCERIRTEERARLSQTVDVEKEAKDIAWDMSDLSEVTDAIISLCARVRAETEAEVTKRERADAALLDTAMRLHVMVWGDFDDGAYGRYDEPAFCWFMAKFGGGPFALTPRARGDTPQEAVRNLFASVRDKQRLKKMLAAYESNDAGGKP